LGVTDKESWLNYWPVSGRTNYPLLFDREGKEKPAYQTVINLVKRMSLSEKLQIELKQNQ